MEKDENSSNNNIAGGQTSWGKTSTFSTNIEKILMKAVLEEKFKTTLLEDRKSVIDNPEFSLTPGDKAMLQSIPSTKLNSMIDTLNKKASPFSGQAFSDKSFSSFYNMPSVP